VVVVVADQALGLPAVVVAVVAEQVAVETALLAKMDQQIPEAVAAVAEYLTSPTAVAVDLVLLLLDTGFNN